MAWVNALRGTEGALDGLDGAGIGRLLHAGSDVVLLVDGAGTVRDATFRSERLRADLGDTADWPGRAWTTLVTAESRGKIEHLLGLSTASDRPLLRHVNYPSVSGPDVAIGHTAVRLSDGRMIAAFGQDLRAYSELHQKLVDAQDAIERDYASLRGAEARARLLFDGSGEALVTVGAANLRLVELNPAATRLFGIDARKGRSLLDLFTEPSHAKLRRLVAMLEANGSASPLVATVARTGETLPVSGSLLQTGDGLLLLVRVGLLAPPRPADPGSPASLLLEGVENAPDGFVCTDGNGAILAANAAFLDMVDAASIEAVLLHGIDEFLGGNGVVIDVLLANLRQRGSVRLFPTTIGGDRAAGRAVEVSAAVASGSNGQRIGFTIRDVARRIATLPAQGAPEPSVPPPERLADLVGRVPLKELVRDATDVIERLCVEQALILADDNRAAAAEMLGLSRQSFYMKLRRFGLGQLAENDE